MALRWPWERFFAGRIPTPVAHWGREFHLPIKPADLVGSLIEINNSCESIIDSDSGFDHPKLATLGLLIVSQVHHLGRERHQDLISLYDKFDPDADANPSFVRNRAEIDFSERELMSRRLFSEICDSIQCANYRRLKPIEIQQALREASHWGVRLRILFSSFRRLEVYGRGDIVAKRLKRQVRNFFRLSEVDVPIYQRLVILFRPKGMQRFPELLDPDCIHIRMFKNVPKDDVDMMLPGSQVRISWADTGKIGIPTIWGVVVLVSKLAKSFWLLAVLGAFKILSSVGFLVAIVVASLFYAVKSSLSYSTTKRRYQLDVARNLYYQNLANNLGALLRLIDEAEQQEACEAILAYYVLSTSIEPYMSLEDVDSKAEALLKRIVGIEIDFDVEDALRNLAAMKIVSLNERGWTAIETGQAIEKMRESK